MEIIRNNKNLFSIILGWTFPLFFAGIFSFISHIYFFQTPWLGKRELFFTGITFVILLPIIHWLKVKVLNPFFSNNSVKARNIILFSSAFFCIIAIISTKEPPLSIFLLPNHHLEVKFLANDIPSKSNNKLTLTYFKTSLKEVSFSEFTTNDGWSRVNDSMVFSGDHTSSLIWDGKVGEKTTLIFKGHPNGGTAEIIWDGKREIINTSSLDEMEIVVADKFQIDSHITYPVYLSLFLGGALLFVISTIAIIQVSIKEREKPVVKNWEWLLFSIPMMLFWMIALLTFWPGMMSRDSMVQWEQAATGKFIDAHPAFHTMIIWLLSKIWNTPAIVAIFQIAFLSIVTSWGIGLLMTLGLSRRLGWILALAFSLSPVNIGMVITLWKDIPYSIGIFLLSLLLLNLVLSKGKWLNKNPSVVWLGINCAFIALVRHNGFPISLGSLLVLLVFFPKSWKRIAFTIGLFFALFFFVRGPLYKIANVQDAPELSESIFIHHIAAHINANTYLTASEETYLNSLRPIEDWDYDCCTVGRNVLYNVLDKEVLLKEPLKPIVTALSLFLRDPTVDIRHQICSSSIVWEIVPRCKTFTLPYGNEWGINNSLSIKESSQIPGLIDFLANYLYYSYSSKSLFSLLAWSSALFLFLGAYCVFIMIVISREKKFVIFFPLRFSSRYYGYD